MDSQIKLGPSSDAKYIVDYVSKCNRGISSLPQFFSRDTTSLSFNYYSESEVHKLSETFSLEMTRNDYLPEFLLFFIPQLVSIINVECGINHKYDHMHYPTVFTDRNLSVATVPFLRARWSWRGHYWPRCSRLCCHFPSLFPACSIIGLDELQFRV